MSAVNLLARGLPVNLSKEQLEKFFSVYGELLEVILCKDFTTGLSRGEAFLKYKDQKTVDAVLKIFRYGVQISGKPVTVEKSTGENHQVIVIGGGLAGCCAAFEAAQNGSFVLLLEKNANIGGNSEKASSGMNASGTPPQKGLNINDSIDLFYQDTIKSGDQIGDPKLVNHLVQGGSSAWNFLKESLSLSLDAVTQCGGHSLPRTHRLPAKEDKATNVGWEIMSAFKKKLATMDNVHILKGVRVLELVKDNGRVAGVITETNGVKLQYRANSVVVTTGGYSCSQELLQKYAPNEANLPTTNGKFATGNGIELCTKVGAFLTGMEHVQVHPTGFVDPKNPTDLTKFLAPEALRGCGGIMLNHEGKRFVNELGRRDHVTQAIFQNCKKMSVDGPNQDKANVVSFLLMNQHVVSSYSLKSVEFYTSRGLVQKFNTYKEFAKAFHLDEKTVEETINQYNKAAKGETPDPLGKTVFPASFSDSETVYVSLITPSIHYTMGGVAINYHTQVLDKDTMSPIPGLYAAGEVTGGVHGKNRLAGNSLLECVVYGRVAGREASQITGSPALIKDTFVKLPLAEKISLSNSTCLFRFALPSPNHYSGLSLGQYIAIRAPIGEGGKPLLRYYSPVSRPEGLGHLDLLIKINTDGPMAKYLSSLVTGSEVEFQGPVNGLEMIVGTHKKIGLLAGGTGIAPMIQIIRAHFLHERKLGLNEAYDISLLFACKDQSEILLRDVLEAHQAKHKNLKIHYSLVEPPSPWNMSVGFVTSDMLQTHMPPPGDDSFIIVCGPPPFCSAMKKYLDGLGYISGKHYYSFL